MVVRAFGSVVAAFVALAVVAVGPASGQDVPTCEGVPATIVGTEGNDRINGTPGDDVIVGLGGRDRIAGGAGNDLICGGEGIDIIKGQRGRDRIFGGPGKDRVFGNSGRDVVDGGPGRDKVFGGGGLDTITGGPGNDIVNVFGQTDMSVNAQSGVAGEATYVRDKLRRQSWLPGRCELRR